jgi:hypothetical protein
MVKKNGKIPALLAILLIVLTPAVAPAQSQQALYDTILRMDSIYFHAYNTCDMATQAAIYADSIEFYHDKGGLETNKQRLLEAIKNNICGKVTRVLVKSSVEVYPIAGYGAVEIGLHQFINHQESETPSKPDKFIVIWRHQNDRWQITRVVSLH